jgi:hypothetical protein
MLTSKDMPAPRRSLTSASGFNKLCRSGIGIAAMLVLSAGSVMAQRIQVIVNGSRVHFEGLGPMQLQGRTMVPVRGVLEKLGAEVAWVESSRTVVASKPGMEIQLPLGEHEATVSGKKVALDVPAQEINGHTMVPLRFLGEALGADVRWDDAARTVIIVTHERQRRDRSDDGDRPRRSDPDRRRRDSDVRPPQN